MDDPLDSVLTNKIHDKLLEDYVTKIEIGKDINVDVLTTCDYFMKH